MVHRNWNEFVGLNKSLQTPVLFLDVTWIQINVSRLFENNEKVLMISNRWPRVVEFKGCFALVGVATFTISDEPVQVSVRFHIFRNLWMNVDHNQRRLAVRVPSNSWCLNESVVVISFCVLAFCAIQRNVPKLHI